MGLTTKQRRFVEAYDGNATRAAIAAGYSERWAASNIDKILKNTEIRAAINGREQTRIDGFIATREERQRFWTRIMRDENADIKDRLRASEVLGRSEGDFIERVEVKGELDFGILFDPEKRRRVLERLETVTS